MKQFQGYLGIGIVLAIIAGVVYVVMSQAPQRPGGQGGPGGRFRVEGPVPVLVATVRVSDVPVYLDGVGTIRALNTVMVRPQVDGKIISIQFKEGQDVERGDVLAQIDPVTYQAQLDQAVAKKAQDEAQLANARRDLDRYIRLAETNSIAKQQADTQRSQVAQLEAQVKQDQAAIDNAQAVLNYTTITAPIAGRTGIRQIDVGNLVRAADATGIVVITQVRPISIIFTLPQQQLSQVNEAMAKGSLPVDALGADNRTVTDRGTLRVVDNQVDQTTGTVRLKAEFPNPDLKLWPGQFVNVKLLVDTLKDAIVVPTSAVQRGPNGTFVFLVTANNTVSMRPVVVAQQDDTQAVISSGLQKSDRVVTTGFAQLADGSAVTIGSTSERERPAGTESQRGRRAGGDSTRSGSTPQGGGSPSNDQHKGGARRSEGSGAGVSRQP